MASLTGQLVAETYKALLKLIDNDILTASEKQITDGFGGGSNVFIDSQGFLRANKYKVTNGLATQFLKADGSLDSNAYLTSITGAQVITALGYTPVPTTRTITINGETHNLAADNSWTVGGTAAIWGNITGTLSNQTDLQNALNAKFDDPTGTISQYIRGDGSIANFPALTGYVPYSGATSNVNLGEYGLTAGFLGFDTTPTGTPTGIGTMYWDSANRTLSLIDGDGDTTLQIGQEERVLVHNNTGATLTDGQIVYVTGSTGELPSVALASNTAEATSSVTLGVVTESIAHGADGFITTSGIVHGLNTLAFTEGAAIYLGSTPGTFTQTKPVAPNNLVLIGYIIKKAGGNGSIFVKIQNGYELDELHDVYIADPANNHGLFYDIADGLWKNKSIVSALGYTPQAQLSGTGFVKASGTTITYDNSTYLTTTDAASTYQRLDKMVSNLLPSSTEYPNSNAVINALALKANAANPVFTGDLSISGATPRLYFVDTDQNPDYTVFIDSGYFYIYDQTAGATRFSINSSGNINTGVGKSITAGSFIKESGTSSQFLMADGSVSTGVANTITGSLTSGYIPKATGANTLGNSLLYENGTKVFIGTTTTNSISTGGLTLSNATSSSLVLYNGAVIGFIYGSSVAAGMAVSSDYDLRFETGDGSGSNWPERMRLFRSTGNLSLGYGNSPTDSGYKLDVNGSVKFSNILDVSGNITLGNGTLFVSAGSGQSYSGRLSVVYSYPYIDTYLDSYAGASYESRLNFRTNSGGGAMSTKMTINNTGYVGIGVTTPGGFLHVKGQFESYYGLILEGTYGTGHQYGWKTNGGNSDVLSLYSITNNGRLAGFGYYESFIQVNGSIRFYISSGGNVLIGTTTDSGYKLDVNGSLRINGVNPSITTDSATDYTIINARKNGTRTWQIDSVGGSYWLYMQGLGAYAMQIASSTGYVGLGTSNPTGTLHIYNSNPAFRIQNSLGGNLQFGQWDSVNNRIEGSGGLPMFITSYSQPIKFGIDGSENMRLSTSGSLGIGTTNPLMQIHSSKAGGNGIFVSNTTSNTGGYLYASTYTFQLQATDSANSSVGTLSLQPFGGNVLIGTGTDNGARLRVVGGTIDFAGDTRYGVARIYNASVGDMFGMEQVGSTQTGGGAATRIFTANSNNNFISLGWYTNATAFVDALKIVATGGAATFVSSVTATSFFESSDIRLKTLIESNPIVIGIEKLEAKLYEKNGKIELGYFAQDAELIMPYAVTKNADGFLNLSYREIHTAKIARLEKEVAELKAQLNLN